MYCGQCGNQIDDDARFCPSCGSRLTNQEQPGQSEGPVNIQDSPYHTSGGSQAPAQPPYGGGPAPHVKNYLVESILCTICCCLPFGIPGIVFAAQVDSKLKSGDVQGAIESSQKAKKWTLVSFIVGIVSWLISIGLNIANVWVFSEYINQSNWY